MRARKISGKIAILASLVAFVVILVLIFTFAGSKDAPTWSDVFKNSESEAAENYLKVLDVGQGDSILIYSNGKSALFDTGSESYGDAVANRLKSLKVKKLDLMLLTHNHEDHVGGAEIISNRLKISNLILPDLSNTSEKTRIITSAKTEVVAGKGECYVAKQGMHTKIGNVNVTVLACYYEDNDENDRSIVTMAEINGKKFLLTGDAGTQSESKMLKEGLNLDCDVLKAGHHGSSGSSGKKLLEAATPDYVAISCGEGNQYSHPHEEALYRYEQIGAKVLRTDLNGEITFSVNGDELNIKTEK